MCYCYYYLVDMLMEVNKWVVDIVNEYFDVEFLF